MDEETRMIRAGKPPAHQARTVGPPVQRGSTVLLPRAATLYDDQPGYGRAGLATHETLKDALRELEGAAGVELYPSGLAAMTGAMLAVLKAGDEVLVADTVYKPTRRFCDRVLTRFGVTVRYYPATLSAAGLLDLATGATRLIVLESPGSLTFEVQDVAGIAARAGERDILTLLDNTWAAGVFLKPLALGVDISVQALTKYVGGHSDVFMGSAAAGPKLARVLAESVHDLGWSVAADDAYQMLRGLRTLPTRLQRHQESGLAIARWLQDQPEVLRLLHPGVPGSPGHEIWARDYRGASGLFAFVLNPVPEAAVHAFLDALSLFGLGFSWGGFESLAINCDPQFGKRSFHTGYGGPVIRLSIGLESPDDLTADLRRGLDALAAG